MSWSKFATMVLAIACLTLAALLVPYFGEVSATAETDYFKRVAGQK